jgi:hypothetical protein
MINCKEQINLSCKNLYPKPITACALYNDHTGSIIKVETINRIQPNKDYTYNLNIFASYDREEIKALNAPVSFRCEYMILIKTFFFLLNYNLIIIVNNDS